MNWKREKKISRILSKDRSEFSLHGRKLMASFVNRHLKLLFGQCWASEMNSIHRQTLLIKWLILCLTDWFVSVVFIWFQKSNRPFLSYLVLFFQNKSFCKTFLIWNQVWFQDNEHVGRTQFHTHFDTEAKATWKWTISFALFTLLVYDFRKKTIVTCLYLFSCTLYQLHIITLSFNWFSRLSMSFVFGYIDYFLVLWHSIENHTSNHLIFD